MKTLVRLEELALFLFSVYLFSTLSFPWWLFPVLLLAPDLSMIGYAGGAALGAEIYHAVHHRGVALILYVAGVWLALPAVSLAGVILLAHSSLDRVSRVRAEVPRRLCEHAPGPDRAAAGLRSRTLACQGTFLGGGRGTVPRKSLRRQQARGPTRGQGARSGASPSPLRWAACTGKTSRYPVRAAHRPGVLAGSPGPPGRHLPPPQVRGTAFGPWREPGACRPPDNPW